MVWKKTVVGIMLFHRGVRACVHSVCVNRQHRGRKTIHISALVRRTGPA